MKHCDIFDPDWDFYDNDNSYEHYSEYPERKPRFKREKVPLHVYFGYSSPEEMKKAQREYMRSRQSKIQVTNKNVTEIPLYARLGYTSIEDMKRAQIQYAIKQKAKGGA